MKIRGEHIDGLLDSGANATILGAGCFERWGFPLLDCATKIRTADGTLRKVDKCVDVLYRLGGREAVVRTLLAEQITKPLILGTDFWRTFDIHPCTPDEVDADEICDVQAPKQEVVCEPHQLTAEKTKQLKEVIELFPFVDPDGELTHTTKIQHRIDTADAEPIRQRPYQMSPYIQAEVNKEVERMLARGIIERVNDSEWLNPVIAVKKSSGGIRLCIDARKLNEVTVKNAYPPQNINHILGRLSGTKFLSALDMTDAFYQIELEESSRPKTAFAIPGFGTFMYRRMPMGLCNSGATLWSLVDKLFGSWPHCTLKIRL